MIKKEDLYYPSDDFKKKAWVNNEKIYKEADKNPVKFWENLAKDLVWKKKWKKAFEHKAPYIKWFLEGKLNITESTLDQNIKKDKNRVALIWEPEPVEEESLKLTYEELSKRVFKLANGLKRLGVKKGDRVGIYMPMVPEIIISMLACARIGAVHSVVFSAFSPQSLRARMQDAEAKILITTDGYYRRGQVMSLKQNADEGVKETKVERMIIVKRAKNEIVWNAERDIWYDDLVKNEKDVCPAEIMDSEDPMFILYTSGSTGKPKGVLHTCGGYAVQTKFTGKFIFDFHKEDVFWCTSDPGWITGHTYTIYSPLMNGVPTLMFEGAPDFPATDRWAQIIEKHKVTIFYTAPTAIRMFEKYGTEILKKYGFGNLRLLGSVGEPIDESIWLWYFDEVGKGRCPIVDTWWQTETGGILITSLPGMGPFKPSFTGRPFPGIKTDILDDSGKTCKPGEVGNLVILSPFSPGILRDVYNNPEKYLETYWSKYGKDVYFTSDGAYRDEDGLIRIIGRVDDAMKVAGHRVSTGELEAAVNEHLEIGECAVIGIPDQIKGEVPVVFAVYLGTRVAEDIKKEIVDFIRKNIGPIALPKQIYLVPDLPKTRSGKIMRRILRKLFTGEDLGDLSTLANPESIDNLKEIINKK